MPDDDQRTHRRVRVVAGGSVAGGLASSGLHLAPIPPGLADQLQLGGLAGFLIAGLYLVQLLLPREFKITFESRRR